MRKYSLQKKQGEGAPIPPASAETEDEKTTDLEEISVPTDKAASA